MGASVKVTGGDKWKKALEPYAKGSDVTVKVGILEGSTYSGETAPAGTLVAPIAAIHEFGGEKKDGTVIPARPFMRVTVAQKQKDWIAAAVSYLKSNSGKVRQAFMLVGEIASKDMQEKIEWGIDPPLKPKTVARKAARGKAHPDTPLIDTGTLQEAISYEVKP